MDGPEAGICTHNYPVKSRVSMYKVEQNLIRPEQINYLIQKSKTFNTNLDSIFIAPPTSVSK